MCLFALAMISCGGSTKQATPSGVTKGTNPTPEGMELATNECIELAEASPVVRAWGNAKHYDLSEAIAYAEADARAKAEKELNSAHYVLMPLAGYSLGSQVWSAGLAVAVEYRSLVLMAQAMKPVIAGLDSFKAWDDLSVVVGAGVRF